jgi:N utilization substance protein A
MSGDIDTYIDYFEREKGISREVLIQAVTDALLSASKKSVGPARELKIDYDFKTGKMRALAKLIVVDKVKNRHDEISLREAQELDPSARLGDEVEKEVTPNNFGRIAAQTAKQAIMQRIRQAEKENLYEEFKDRAGEIVSGTVKRFERSDVVVELGKFEAVMPSRERVSTEDYNVGDRIRAYVLAVENGPRGPEIVLSRSHPNFVRRLFEVEVSEIADRTVEIISVAREAGFRTKIAVHSKDEKVDPVGACVGLRGARVKNIVRELNNEKIDIIRYSEDAVEFVIEALKPARVKSATLEEEGKKIRVIVDEDQLSLAIGRRGQNARLTSRLCGVDVAIEKYQTPEQGFEQRVTEAVNVFVNRIGIDEDTARMLVMSGFASLEGLIGADPKDLVESMGIEESDAQAILEKAASAQEKS